MKPFSFRQRLLTFRLAGILLLIPVLLLYSFHSRMERYADLWQQLGITEKNGSDMVSQSFINGYLQHWGMKNLKNIVISDRKSITTDLLAFTRKYVQSEDFKKTYQDKRQRMKPREVTKKPRTEDQIREEQIASTKKAMTNVETSLKTATTDDLKKIYQDSYNMQKKQLDELQKPDNKMIPMMAKMDQQQYEAEMKRYEDQMRKWEEKYPADLSAFIKLRLQEVLKATEGIDYNAELTERNGKKYFVKQEYEKKDTNWKAGFRAGKEVTETVRGYVLQWMNEQ
jgi:hypothetical protein